MDYKAVAIWLVRAAMTGIVSFAAPRFVVGLGLPIDRWSSGAGRYVGLHFSAETATWGLTAIVFAALLFFTRHRGEKHIHHLPIQAETKPIATQGMKVTRAPQFDATLTEAALYAVAGQWGMMAGKEHFPTNKERAAAGDKVAHWLADFEQKASDGSVRVWGKPRGQSDSPLVEIDALHWRDHEAYPLSVATGEPTTRIRGIPANTDGFEDLRVNKAEFEREWPHA